MTFHAVAKLSDVGAGDIVPVAVGGVEMILYRVGEKLYAAQRRCLHQGADLSEGLVLRGAIVCANHGWRFDATTGQHEASSANCLVMYEVQVRGDEVWIDPTPLRRGGMG